MQDKILVLDMDCAGSVELARRLRSQHIFCKIISGEARADEVSREDPGGIIWLGAGELPPYDAEIINLGIPILALSEAATELGERLGALCESQLFTNTAASVTYGETDLFEGVLIGERWFTCASKLHLPDKLTSIARANGSSVGFADTARNLFGLMFTIERNDPDGARVLMNFCKNVCGCTQWWSAEAFVERTVNEIARLAGGDKLVCAVSGGVDSSVCAMLCEKAVGDRLVPVYVENGLARTGSDRMVDTFCKSSLKLEPLKLEATQLFLDKLRGVEKLEDKKSAVAAAFRETISSGFGDEAKDTFLVMGTNYSELLAARLGDVSARQFLPFKGLIEPLVELFKEEVRDVGELLGLAPSIVSAQQFPMTGLAGRINRAVDEPLLELLRKADAIYSEELERAGQEKKLSLYYATLEISHKISLVLHAFTSGDNSQAARIQFDLIGRVAERVARDLPEIDSVYYDFTAK